MTEFDIISGADVDEWIKEELEHGWSYYGWQHLAETARWKMESGEYDPPPGRTT